MDTNGTLHFVLYPMEPLAQGGGSSSDPPTPPPPATGLYCVLFYLRKMSTYLTKLSSASAGDISSVIVMFSRS